MKKFFFLIIMVLFGLSQISFSQCSANIQVVPNGCEETFLIVSADNPISYNWSTGSNLPFTIVSVSGQYYVTVCCSSGEYTEANVFVEVEPCNTGGGCNFNIAEQKNCNMNKLTVTDCPDCIQWSWSNGAKTSSIDVVSTGTYTVTVTGSGGCTSEASHQVTEIKKVNPVISGSTQVCPGMKTVLTASGGTTYKWSNGLTSSSGNFAKGNYIVTVTDASGCTASVNASVSEFPVGPAPTVIQSVNADGVITLTSTLPSGNLWSNNATTQSITPPDFKLYTLKVKDQNGCFSLSSLPLVAGQKVKIEKEIVYIDTCVGQVISVCPLSAGFSHEIDEVNLRKVYFRDLSSGEPELYIWNFGDGGTGIFGTEKNPTHIYEKDGWYEVKLTVVKDGEVKTFSNTVFINSKTGNGGGGNATCPPMVSFMYTIDGMNVHFKNTSSGDGLLNYLWEFGDGTNSTEENPIHKYSQYKDYKVILHVNTTMDGWISASQMIYVVNQGVLNGTVCDSVLIKASNGMKNGEAILPSQISSQTKLVLEHPGARDWSWSPTGQATNWSLAKYNVGKHHFYVSYFVNNQKQCSVFDYEILGGGLTDTDDAENRSREDKIDINVSPNPTSGPVEIDLSGLPGGQYMINIINQSGQNVTKKVIKQ